MEPMVAEVRDHYAAEKHIASVFMFTGAVSAGARTALVRTQRRRGGRRSRRR